MADNYIGFKLLPEQRAAIIDRAREEGITASEWIRAAIANALDGQTPSVDEGYHQARRLAAKMAQYALANGFRALPATYDEFMDLIKNPNHDPEADVYG